MMSTVSSTSSTVAAPSPPPVRPVLAEAVDLARSAAVELAEGPVGAHLGVHDEPGTDGAAATHRFAADRPGYQGWEWAVVVAAVPDGTVASVSEVVLLPGAQALVSPTWLPWEERVRPGDLGPGDLLPPPADDPRLVPGYLAGDDPAVEELATEVGLGRRQVMSRDGRLDAAERWFDGEGGPNADVARVTVLGCGTCGFYLPLAGSLRAAFGVCGNEMASDGKVVHAEFGCGAHSDVVVEHLVATPVSDRVHDDGGVELVAMPRVTEPSGAAERDPAEAPLPDPGTPAPAEPPAVPPQVEPGLPDPDPDDFPPAATPEPADPDAPVDPQTPIEPDEPTRSE